MISRPLFSILHATARPEQFQAVYERWMGACGFSPTVEYIACIDAGARVPPCPPNCKIVVNEGRKCCVDAYNAAAKASTGRVLVMIADDLYPCEHWDSELLKVISDLNAEAVVQVNCKDPWPWIMTHPIMTRAYYEKPGRGACGGEFFYPEYLSMGPDDDLTEYAKLDGVLIDARNDIVFEHRHPKPEDSRLEDLDPVYRHEMSAEAFAVKDRVLTRRRAQRFGKGPQTLAIVTPGASFPAQWLAEYDKLVWYTGPRFKCSRVYGMSNNIYLVRQYCAETVLKDPSGVPDYVLWIDSDNPPSVDAFSQLMAQLQASEQRPEMPPIDIIGAWYRYCRPSDEKTFVAAGRTSGLRSGQLTESDIRKAVQSQSLIEDLDYIGFGLLLMRGSVLAKLGPQGFWPMPIDDGRGFLTDDVSWCARALEAGYRIYVHPGAFVEHLKFSAVPPALAEKVQAISDSKEFVEEKAS